MIPGARSRSSYADDVRGNELDLSLQGITTVAVQELVRQQAAVNGRGVCLPACLPACLLVWAALVDWVKADEVDDGRRRRRRVAAADEGPAARSALSCWGACGRAGWRWVVRN